MHAKAIEIAWHDATSIWSVDLSIANRLVTAGGDKVARVWQLHSRPYEHISKPTFLPAPNVGQPLVEWLCDLRAHTTTVNVARFTRDGYTIATGADRGEIVLWSYEEGDCASGMMEAGKERWVRLATLRGHVQDVLDLAWSKDGSKLISASVDNSILVWDARNPSSTPVALRNHANFVQGVSIDPLSRLIASLGSDRTLRIFTASNAKSWYQVASLSSIQDAKLFIDDSRFKNCFRRLAWSPDGSIVACPSGIHFPVTKRQFAVHIFARNQWVQPAAQCGGLQKPALAVRFSPVLYELRKGVNGSETSEMETADRPFTKFTYRMIFAVLCADSLFFYDTEAFQRPFARVTGLHVAEQSDLTWSSDGLTVAVSATDGYVGLVCFSAEELGQKLSISNTPPWLLRQEDPCASRRPKNTTRPVVTVVQPQSLRESDKLDHRPSELPRKPHSHRNERSLNCPTTYRGQKATVPDVVLPPLLQEVSEGATKRTTGQGYRISAAKPRECIQSGTADRPMIERRGERSSVSPSKKARLEKQLPCAEENMKNQGMACPTPSGGAATTEQSGVNQTAEAKPVIFHPERTNRNISEDGDRGYCGDVKQSEINAHQRKQKTIAPAEIKESVELDEPARTLKSGERKTSTDSNGSTPGEETTKNVVEEAIPTQNCTGSVARIRMTSQPKTLPNGSSPTGEALTPKRRIKTKQVQMTLLSFQSPSSGVQNASTKSVPADRSEGSNSDSSTLPLKRQLDERLGKLASSKSTYDE